MALRSVIRSALRPVLRPVFGGGASASLREQVIDELFGAGQQGSFGDPSDSSTCFQDAALVTPAGADDPVRVMLDLSGNNMHFVAPNDASRPTRRTDGSLWWLEFDGVEDKMDVGVFDEADFSILFGLSNAVDSSSTHLMGGDVSTSAAIGVFDNNSPSSINSIPGSASDTFVNLSAVSPATREQFSSLIAGVNCMVEISPVTRPAGGLCFGGHGGAARYEGNAHAFIACLSASDKDLARAWVAAMAGATLP